MAKKVEFIPRNGQLEQIVALSNIEYDSCNVLCIDSEDASGGIGKTRLLQEAYNKLKELQYNIRLTDIIDFDDRRFHKSHSILRKISQMLGKDNFSVYQEKEADFARIKYIGISKAKFDDEVTALNRSFATCFNQTSKYQRVVLFFDTTDSLKQDTKVWHALLDLLPFLNNYLVIIAGRNAQKIRKFLEGKLTESPIDFSSITVKRFSDDESQAYLSAKQKQLANPLEHGIMEKLLILANGRPILIDLAIEWHSRNSNKLDWITDMPLSRLKKMSDIHKQQKQAEFEKQLILHIADVRHDMDRLTLALAHVYPMDSLMISKLLDLSESDTEALFKTATRSVFIKQLPGNKISLHDEMRRMVNQYLWKEVDSDNYRKIHYSKIASKYFYTERQDFKQKIIEKIETQGQNTDDFFEIADFTQKRQLMTEEWIRHAFIADVNKGFEVYKQAVNAEKDTENHFFAYKLGKLDESYKKQLNSDQLFEFFNLEARLLYGIGQAEKAQTRFQTLLKHCESDTIDETTRQSRLAEIYNGLGVSKVYLNNLQGSLVDQKKALAIFQELNRKDDISVAANYLGYTYRLMGKIDTAIDYYNKALEASQEGNVSQNTIADITNNLGYAFAITGRFDEALNHCQEAYDKWCEIGRTVKIGSAEVTLAQIYNYQGKTAEAIRYAKKALKHFEDDNAGKQLFRPYRCLGWSDWLQGNPDDLNVLKQSLNNFQKSIDIAHKYNQTKELPGILIDKGYVHWALGDKDKARELNKEGYQLAKQNHEMYAAVNGLLSKAEYDYADGKYNKIANHAKTLQQEYEDKGYVYPLFSGRMKRLQAIVAFKNKDYDTALHYYKQGLAQIAQHGGYGVYSINSELNALKNKLKELTPSDAMNWCKTCKAYWEKQAPANKYTRMLGWCDLQINQADLDIKQKKCRFSSRNSIKYKTR